MSLKRKTQKTPPQSQESWKIPADKLAEVQSNTSVIVNFLQHKYKFGPYEKEDLEHEALIKVNKEFDKFDPERAAGANKLYNFMFVIINRLLYNLKRDKFRRFSPPCQKCPLNAYINKKCTAYENLEECSYYADWIRTNEQKEMLMHVFSIDDSKESGQLSTLERMERDEQIGEIRNYLKTLGDESLLYLFDSFLENNKES